MTRNVLFAFSCFAVLLLARCGNDMTIQNIDWVVGRWEGRDVNDLVFHESWERAGQHTLSGQSFTTSPEGDTLWREALKVEMVEGVPYYVALEPKTKAPILFKMIEGDAHHAVFENKERDFPKRVFYRLETNNTMTIKREGFEDGKPKVESLQFERVKGDSLTF